MNKKTLIIAAITAAVVLLAFLLLNKDDSPSGAERTANPAATKLPPPLRRDRDLRVAGFDVLADDDRVGSLRLEGQVIDDTEDPVDGAEVVISSNPRRTATTGEDGTFFFDKLVGRPYTLVARTDEGAAGPVTARLTSTSDPVILRLRPAPTLEVTVLSAADREPIPGATVELRGLLATSSIADQDGIAIIRGVAPGFYRVAGVASGFASSQQRMRVRSAQTTYSVELLLKRGAAASGVVVTKGGKPVEGAQVVYRGASDRSLSGNPRFDSVTTTADGRFSFAALPEGTFRFTSRHPSFAPGESEPITLTGKSAAPDIQVVVEDGAVLAGRVTTEDGQPAAFAAVRVANAGGGRRRRRPRQVFSDEQGRFEITGLARKPVNVVALHEKATSKTLEADLESVPIQKDVELVLGLNGVIAGVVVDTTGEPVDGAQVSLRPDFGDRRFSFAEMRLRGFATEVTDAGGQFEFRGLADMNYSVMATPPGSESRFRGRRNDDSAVQAEIGDTEVRVVIEARGSMVGKLAFADGSAVTTFAVAMGGFRGGATPFSDKDGKFRVADLEPGEYAPRITGPAFDRAVVPKIKVVSGKEADLGTITVERGRSLSGKVVTSSGSPVANATVVAGQVVRGSGATSSRTGFGRGRGGNKTTTTGDDGAFTLNGLSASSLVIIAEHETLGRTTSVELPATTESAADLTLTLAPPGAVDGSATVNGKPADGARITAQSQNVPTATFNVRTGADGKFRFDKLAPDDYLITARVGDPRSGFATASQAAKVTSNSVASVAVAIERGEVTLVVQADGDGVNFARVYVAQGSFSASTAKELEAQLAKRTSGFSTDGIVFEGKPAFLEGLVPDQYSVCVVAAPAELAGRAAFGYIAQNGASLPAVCKDLQVKASPAEQDITIPVTVPELLEAN